MKRWTLSLGIAALCSIAAQAHHSIASVYDSSRQVKIEGLITQFFFVSPHPYVMAVVTDQSGRGQWRLEMDNRRELADVGIASDTLKPNDRIIVTGSPARQQQNSLYVRRLDRPSDGFWYEQVGSSPRSSRGTR
jgi:hypothetical protein